MDATITKFILSVSAFVAAVFVPTTAQFAQISPQSIGDRLFYPECRFTVDDDCIFAKAKASVVAIKTVNGSGRGVIPLLLLPIE